MANGSFLSGTHEMMMLLYQTMKEHTNHTNGQTGAIWLSAFLVGNLNYIATTDQVEDSITYSVTGEWYANEGEHQVVGSCLGPHIYACLVYEAHSHRS